MNLAALYEDQTGKLPLWDGGPTLWLAKVVGSALLLSGITALAWRLRRRCPYFIVGWLWFCGMMLPVIGLLPGGVNPGADRYMYLPQIGLSIAVAWGALDWLRHTAPRWRVLQGWAWGIATVLVLTALTACSAEQTAYWHDSETLWRHALSVNDNLSLPHDNLANIFSERGELDAAIEHYHKSLHADPDYTLALNNLGNALNNKGEYVEAEKYIRRAIELDPEFLAAHYNLGNVLMQQRRIPEAISEYEEALRIDPDYTLAHNNLGNLLSDTGRYQEAIDHYQAAAKVMPDYAPFANNLGNAYARMGEVDKAARYYHRAIELKPDFADALNNLGTLLNRQGKLDEALKIYQRAIDAQPTYAPAHFNLGVACWHKKRYADTLKQWRAAMKIDPNNPLYPRADRDLAIRESRSGDSQWRRGCRAGRVEHPPLRRAERDHPRRASCRVC